MRHLELHIIQSVPVACLNRDDLNSPKTAIFGGVQRARVSSQSWKRAIRELAKEYDNDLFKGNRTKRMVFELKKRLVARGLHEAVAVLIAEQVAGIVETLDSKKTDNDGSLKIKTLMFFSEAEYDAIVDAIVKSEEMVDSFEELHGATEEKESAQNEEDKKEKKIKAAQKKIDKLLKPISKGSIAKSIKSAKMMDAADVALFGRMVANDPSLKVEAAAMFSHALSTHKVDNEIDFFSAVDDLQSEDVSGAGMTGTLEFNSATYYRFAALNLDMLADEEHLGALSEEQRKSVVKTFVEATIKAIPGARKNTMNGNTLPNYVLGVVREKGHPVQLINAFENPLRTAGGYGPKSVELLKDEYARLEKTWGLEASFEGAIPEKSLRDFLEGVEEHVR